MIVWNEKFETGSDKLDQQHRLLIDNINLLGELLHTTDPNPQEASFAFELVDYLEAYANIHFNCEEECMDRYQCPVREKNREEHEKFRGFIHQYKKLCDLQGYRVELLRNLHDRMESWIQEHILKMDTQLKPCTP